jgi:hypothetical protein
MLPTSTWPGRSRWPCAQRCGGRAMFGPRYNEGDAQKDYDAVSNDTSGNVSNVRLLRHEYTVVEPR